MLLFGRHGDEVCAIDAAGQLFEDFVASASEHDGLERGGDLIEFFVADDFAGVVGDLVFVEESEEGSESVAVDEFEDGVEFFESIFDGCTGEDDGVLGLESFDDLGGASFPVFDALSFVEDDEVW